jgi:hypothetical protein
MYLDLYKAIEEIVLCTCVALAVVLAKMRRTWLFVSLVPLHENHYQANIGIVDLVYQIYIWANFRYSSLSYCTFKFSN